MNIKKITNPVYKDLKSLKLIDDKNLVLLNKKTRDKKNLAVYSDKLSNIIFLAKYLPSNNYYKKKQSNRKKIGKNSYSIFKKKKY